jgi:ubiquitin carboxyl-terminal hydrolase 9/24
MYIPIQVATVGGSNHPQVQPEDIAGLPPTLPDEFVLAEGRPGKETGVYELTSEPVVDANGMQTEATDGAIKETEDESASRRLLEEVQRTFIHLKEGSKGRCFDPRALVEACACLKLEFDVWQQNDASEFATKLLDRLEISLKRWAPAQFDYMDHKFGMQQTKQKICKECGLKTNREEKLLNIDCQIRGKSDIHEALAAMTEVEIMEGSNKVYCDKCKKNTDTVLRTAISTLPNMLLLSLKRFDLDYTTFETVKLNSRCAFGQTLNMKKYTLEDLESAERASGSTDSDTPVPMDTEETEEKIEDEVPPLLPDEDYEYRLAGVLVHAGVAQGGHYYSFINDRNQGEEKWFRFDDEDVTPFDPSLIESECFGGKVKKETKWPNGQVHTVEQEQFANALMLFYEKVKPTPMSEERKTQKKEKDTSEPITAHVKTLTGYDAFEPDVRRSNAMHRWQSFLFDSEFQSFMKGMLGFCRLSVSPEQNVGTANDAKRSWLQPMTDMILSFVFDVLLYSSDFSSLSEWIDMLEELLRLDVQSAVPFVQKLARKTRFISSNWLRTFLLECPEKAIRSEAVRVFSAATITYALSGTEMTSLAAWTQAWKEQVHELGQSVMSDEPRLVPCTLEGRWKVLEDVDKIGSGGASSLGIILSFLNVLLDAMPRCWRFNTETCLYIRNLAKASLDGGKKPLQKSMVYAMIPARLVALLARERAPTIIKSSFPAASISREVANIQARPESNPSAHVVPMSTNAVLNTPDTNNQRGPSAGDYLVLFEALLCIGGLSGTVHASLVHNSDDMGRSRQRYFLSEKAAKALRVVFQENCAPGAPGMGRREVEAFLRRCGVDRGSMSPQKIHDILSKYPTTGEGNGNKGEVYLSFDGFLSYYRDCVQSNDIRLRMDLHTFGFRPDLSRRSKESRFMVIRERDVHRETLRTPIEGVAIDVAETLGDHLFDVGRLANMALVSTVTIHSLACTVSEPIMEYIVAASVYGKDAEPLINRILQMIYQTPNDWAGNERVSGAMMILQTIASTPGEHQQSNIAKIMLSTIKPTRTVSFGGGLLEVTRALHGMTRASQYNNEVYLHFARYMGILRDLHGIYPIFQWMNENRTTWSFIERDLLDNRVSGQHQNARSEYATRDLEHSVPLDHNAHSDSDMAGMNDSEDDEDSQFDNLDGQIEPVANDGPFQITVQGSGNPAVNGVYSQDGFFANACRYTKHGRWNNTDYKFYIFQCHVSNNTRHWYISIVPYGGNPGTSSDIDFYTGPVTEECRHIPPRIGWVKANEGKDPCPTLDFRYLPDEGNDTVDVDLNGNGPVVEGDADADEPQHAYV